MKVQTLGFAILLSFGLHVDGASVRLDISNGGDIPVGVDTKPETSPPPKRGHPAQPRHSSKTASHNLEEYQVDTSSGPHAGKPSESGKFVSFKNIPYADPPIDEFSRFAAPQFPEYNETVNHGWNGNICPQVQLGWVPKAMEFLEDFKNPPALADWEDPISPADYGPLQYPAENVSEDCLTLDVMVPKAVWEDRDSDRFEKPTVVVWVHGGGLVRSLPQAPREYQLTRFCRFVSGSKNQYGSPEGLFDAAVGKDEDNVVFVAMNYRLGAFGFLGGAKYQVEGGMTNLGLLDQALAMEWVLRNIEQFGGDSFREVVRIHNRTAPVQITMMGQDAGGSSIMHHITSSNRNKPRIRAAIVQSPGYFPKPGHYQNDVRYKRFLELTNAEDLEALAALDSKVLQEANAKLVHESTYGYFNFGPTFDDNYVQDLPSLLLQRSLEVPSLLLGYASMDGLYFTPPWIRTTEALLSHMHELNPDIPQDVMDVITSDYAISTGSNPQDSILAASQLFNVGSHLQHG
ncbi:MAG: hypothetical protein Q9174_006295 [Haloplaca sp. 1 TL-2023]